METDGAQIAREIRTCERCNNPPPPKTKPDAEAWLQAAREASPASI